MSLCFNNNTVLICYHLNGVLRILTLPDVCMFTMICPQAMEDLEMMEKVEDGGQGPKVVVEI